MPALSEDRIDPAKVRGWLTGPPEVGEAVPLFGGLGAGPGCCRQAAVLLLAAAAPAWGGAGAEAALRGGPCIATWLVGLRLRGAGLTNARGRGRPLEGSCLSRFVGWLAGWLASAGGRWARLGGGSSCEELFDRALPGVRKPAHMWQHRGVRSYAVAEKTGCEKGGGRKFTRVPL